MAGRTFAFGDIHGGLSHLERLWAKLPALDAGDTLVFLGDYVDRGPDSKGVVDFMMSLPGRAPAKVVCLLGNHEEAWLRVRKAGWPEFVLPEGNGCWASLRSFAGRPAEGEKPSREDFEALYAGSFFPEEAAAWMSRLPRWHEDAHAIYVHAGLPEAGGRFLHPSEAPSPDLLLWQRSERFFKEYRGKRVVCGHTATRELPQELSSYTPEDPSDLWFRGDVAALDTKCGKPDGFLTALELPSLLVYDSR